jgi:hypothetical protein
MELSECTDTGLAVRRRSIQEVGSPSSRSPLILASFIARARALDGHLVLRVGHRNNTLCCSYRTATETDREIMIALPCQSVYTT